METHGSRSWKGLIGWCETVRWTASWKVGGVTSRGCRAGPGLSEGRKIALGPPLPIEPWHVPPHHTQVS